MADIGKRLLPVTIDAIARREPDRPWASMPRKSNTDFHDIPFKDLANAINRTAHWIVRTVGKAETNTSPTITYLGPSDLRYYVMLLAIVKAGYKACGETIPALTAHADALQPLFISHRNSNAANAALFEATQCGIFLTAFVDIDALPVDKETQTMRHFQVPSSETLWDPEPVEPFPFLKSFDEASKDPFVILHTSGSSGFPKPVVYTHGALACADLRQTVPSPPGTQTEVKLRAPIKRALIGFPPFHAAGLLVGLQDTVWYEQIIVLPPAAQPLDGAMLRDILPASGAGGAYVLPHVIEQVARMPDALAVVEQHLKYLIWVGGPISQEAGIAISGVTQLLQSYATTELGSVNTLTSKRQEDWNYHWFTPGANGFDFRAIPSASDEEQLYELFVVRDPARSLPVFEVFPHIDEWPTNDLFSRHPDPAYPHLWKHEGRADDLLVLANGSKLNPRPIEVAIAKHPLLRDALVVGDQRARPAVVLEPNAPVAEADRQAFVDSVMPAIEASNSVASRNGQIERSLVLVAEPARHFPRTGKNTIQRRAAAEMYKPDVEAAYAALPEALREATSERVQTASV